MKDANDFLIALQNNSLEDAIYNKALFSGVLSKLLKYGLINEPEGVTSGSLRDKYKLSKKGMDYIQTIMLSPNLDLVEAILLSVSNGAVIPDITLHVAIKEGIFQMLINQRLIEQSENSWSLTSNGKAHLNNK